MMMNGNDDDNDDNDNDNDDSNSLLQQIHCNNSNKYQWYILDIIYY